MESHFSRARRILVSVKIGQSNSRRRLFSLTVSLLALPILALAQYPGQVTKTPDKKALPTLRAISVYEWTGDLEKPKACRLIPVMVYDGEHMQDATVYLARPEPMAVAPEVEYELEENGRAVSLFDVKNAAVVEGQWVGLGAPKPLPKPRQTRAKKPQVQIDDFGESDRPVLHRKHPQQKDTDSKSPDSTADKGSDSSASAPDDPDRPHLHRKPATDDSSASTNTTASTTAGTGPTPDTSATTPPTNPDPDRPQLHRPKKQKEVEGSVSSVDSVDPDRPRLRRGARGESTIEMIPGLKGLPADLDQAVAVSDAVTRPEHPWNFTWSNPDDAEKMKEQLEQIARDALGMTPPPAPKPKSTKAGTRKPQPAQPQEPPALGDENFRVFELSYGSGATLVLTATNNQPGLMQRFITLIAQPDLYGNPLILLKQVTDPAHLDENPRMRLVDAVDALADNRGELLFELRTTDDRQFALYRVLRGTAEKIFVSGGANPGANP
jgi:hypothetical protein